MMEFTIFEGDSIKINCGGGKNNFTTILKYIDGDVLFAFTKKDI